MLSDQTPRLPPRFWDMIIDHRIATLAQELMSDIRSKTASKEGLITRYREQYTAIAAVNTYFLIRADYTSGHMSHTGDLKASARR